MVVHPECKRTTEALRRLRWKDNGYELENNAFREPFDALSYYTYNYYPTDRVPVQPVMMAG